MAKRIQKKTENPNRQLYEDIGEKIKLIEQGLGSLYFGEKDEISLDLIHGLRKGVFYVEDIVRDLLFEEKTAKEILAERR